MILVTYISTSSAFFRGFCASIVRIYPIRTPEKITSEPELTRWQVAEREGFEPSVDFRLHVISNHGLVVAGEVVAKAMCFVFS